MADLLIVDDDVDVSWILTQVLLLEGHTVRVGYDGEEGLRLLKERVPDLVLLDVEMPILNGPSLADQMFVHNLGLENVPIVLLSGVADVEAVAEQVGTPYALAKPFAATQLLALIDRALGERGLSRPAV
jgi:DNA-binding NtrC family response regulator